MKKDAEEERNVGKRILEALEDRSMMILPKWKVISA